MDEVELFRISRHGLGIEATNNNSNKIFFANILNQLPRSKEMIGPIQHINTPKLVINFLNKQKDLSIFKQYNLTKLID